MSQSLLRACGAVGSLSRQCVPQLSLLAPVIAGDGGLLSSSSPLAAAQGPVLLGSGSSHQLQQQRGAAAKKKTPAAGKAAKKGTQATAKKQKQKMDTKPFDDKDPLMQKLVAMLVPAREQQLYSPQQQRAVRAAGRELRLQHNARHQAWAADMRTKLALKTAALKALPPDLRKAAAEEDLAPFPLTRHFLYDSPPDAYKERWVGCGRL
jgi:hypothetical protein